MRLIQLLLVSLFAFTAQAASLEEKVDALANELASLKEQMAGPSLGSNDQSYSGMGTSASKVYYSKSPLSIGGYGEVVMQSLQGSSGDSVDALRFVPYIGYRFSDKIILNAEIEIEHANSAFLEFGYLDFLLHKSFNIRTGLLLVPVGLTNKLHEPTLFPSVNRPEIEKNIIPSTWRENGAVVYGEYGIVYYEAGIVNGFDGSSFSDSNWLRGGRQKGSQAKADDWAGVARVDVTPIENLTVGGSFYKGDSNQDNGALGRARVTLWEAHLMYAWRALQLRALFVSGELTDADLVSTATGKTVGSKAEGYYVEAQYNIMPLINAKTTSKLNIFSRFEDYDTNKEVGTGFTRDLSNDRTRTVVGVNYFPHSNVVLKTNWVFRDNESTSEEADLFELGMGYIF